MASIQLGKVADLPIVEHIGSGWTWLAVAVWVVVFGAVCLSLSRRVPGSRRRVAVSVELHR